MHYCRKKKKRNEKYFESWNSNLDKEIWKKKKYVISILDDTSYVETDYFSSIRVQFEIDLGESLPRNTVIEFESIKSLLRAKSGKNYEEPRRETGSLYDATFYVEDFPTSHLKISTNHITTPK